MRPANLEKLEQYSKEEVTEKTVVHDRLYIGGIQRMLAHFRKMDEEVRKQEEDKAKELVFKPTISKPPAELNLPPFLERMDGQMKKREAEMAALKNKVEKERDSQDKTEGQVWKVNEMSEKIMAKKGHKGPISGFKEHAAVREAIKNTTVDDIRFFSERGEASAFVGRKIGKTSDTTTIDLVSPEQQTKPQEQSLTPTGPKKSVKKACLRLYNYGTDLKMKKEEAKAHRDMLLDMGIDPETGKRLHTPIIHESPDSPDTSQRSKDVSRYELLYQDFHRVKNKKGEFVESELAEAKKSSTPNINKSLVINKANKDVMARYMEDIKDPTLKEKRLKELEKQVYSTPKSKVIKLDEHLEGITKSIESYKKKANEMKEKKKELELQGCTFEPNTNTNDKMGKRGKGGEELDGSGAKKRKRNDEIFEKIYKQGQEKKQRMEKLEVENQIKKEKELKECTFKPASVSRSKVLGSIDYTSHPHGGDNSQDDLLAGLREVRSTLLGELESFSRASMDLADMQDQGLSSMRTLGAQPQVNMNDLLFTGGYDDLEILKQDLAIETILNENVPSIGDLLDNNNNNSGDKAAVPRRMGSAPLPSSTQPGRMGDGHPGHQQRVGAGVGGVGPEQFDSPPMGQVTVGLGELSLRELDAQPASAPFTAQQGRGAVALGPGNNNTVGTETAQPLLSDLVADLL